MVWGYIIEGRKGPLVVLEYLGGHGGGMTAKQYQEQVLSGPLHIFYQEMSEERGIVVFQERMVHHPIMQRAQMFAEMKILVW